MDSGGGGGEGEAETAAEAGEARRGGRRAVIEEMHDEQDDERAAGGDLAGRCSDPHEPHRQGSTGRQAEGRRISEVDDIGKEQRWESQARRGE